MGRKRGRGGGEGARSAAGRVVLGGRGWRWRAGTGSKGVFGKGGWRWAQDGKIGGFLLGKFGFRGQGNGGKMMGILRKACFIYPFLFIQAKIQPSARKPLRWGRG